MTITDIINKLVYYIDLKIHDTLYFLISIGEKLCILPIGVKLGKNVVFRGWTHFYRSTYSTIIIGSNCKFNSSTYTNPIGLNHKCIVTTMTPQARIVIGKNCGFSSSTITSFESVTIGDNVRVGANCVIMDGDFHLDDVRTPKPAPITISDNVWLGANVVVMKGVTIGENSVIGMNSIVTKNIPANCVAAGNPAKVIKQLDI